MVCGLLCEAVFRTGNLQRFRFRAQRPQNSATGLVRRIALLYAVEELVRGQSPAHRLAVRRARSKPIVDALQSWLEATLPSLPPRGKLAEAMRYALTRWDGLTRFLDDGRIELDTNPVERAIRPVALGRKSWLFAGSDRGGQRAAVMYSLIVTAKMNDVDPQAWLADVLARIADHPASKLDELLPWNWRKHAPASADAA